MLLRPSVLCPSLLLARHFSSAAPRRVPAMDPFPPGARFADPACLACPDPCPPKWLVPDDVKREIDHDGGIAGSIKPYSRHLLVCAGSGPEWPAQAEGVDAVGGAAAAVKALKGSVPGKTLVGAAESQPDLFPAPPTPGNLDLLLLPAMRSLSLPPASLDSLLPGFLLSPSSFPGSLPLPYTHLVLVCIHARRDTRCGRIGPAVVAALKEVVEEKGLKVKVAGCSHVGGHKWAGNVIVYPGGDWFGRVLPHHAPALIEEYVGKGNLLKELWRGRIGEEA